MNVLIVGVAGFIGTHLKARIQADGHTVFGIDIDGSSKWWKEDAVPFDSALIDIRSETDMRVFQAPIDACVHLAAMASPWKCQKEPETAWNTNVMGTYNVLSLCKRLGVKRVVFPSSAHVYGISPRYIPTNEEHPLTLLDTYTTTKVMGERLCEEFWKYHGLSYAVLRLYNVFGPRQNPDFLIGAKIAQAKTGKITLRTKQADVTKDFVHVSDIVKGITLALRSDYVGPINLGFGREVALKEVVGRIAEGFGIKHIEGEDSEDGGPSRMCADWARAKTVLGWKPEVRFEDGLAELIRGSRIP